MKREVKPPRMNEPKPGTWMFRIEAVDMLPFGRYSIYLDHGQLNSVVLKNDVWLAFTLKGAVRKGTRIMNRVNNKETALHYRNLELKKVVGKIYE